MFQLTLHRCVASRAPSGVAELSYCQPRALPQVRKVSRFKQPFRVQSTTAQPMPRPKLTDRGMNYRAVAIVPTFGSSKMWCFRMWCLIMIVV